MNSRIREEQYWIREAVAKDIPALTRVINTAFVVEKLFIEGDRVDDDATGEYMHKGTFLIAEDAGGNCWLCFLRSAREARISGSAVGSSGAARERAREEVDAGCGRLFSAGGV